MQLGIAPQAGFRMEAESTRSPASGILKAWWARIGIKCMFPWFFDEVGANAQFTRELGKTA